MKKQACYLIVAVVLIPAVADIANDHKGEKREVDNAAIKTLSGFFAQLLGCFGTNGALCGNCGGNCREKQEESYY